MINLCYRLALTLHRVAMNGDKFSFMVSLNHHCSSITTWTSYPHESAVGSKSFEVLMSCQEVLLCAMIAICRCLHKDLKSFEFALNEKHEMQWVIPKESIHVPKQEVNVAKIIENSITNTMKVREKLEREKLRRERNSTMQMAITKVSMYLGELGPHPVERAPLFIQVMLNR